MGSRALKMQREALGSRNDLTTFEKIHTWIDAVKNVEGYDVQLSQLRLALSSSHLFTQMMYRELYL